MTDDLVKRLNDFAAVEGEPTASALKEAASRIEKLEAALRKISHLDYKSAATNFAVYDAHKIARKALEGKND